MASIDRIDQGAAPYAVRFNRYRTSRHEGVDIDSVKTVVLTDVESLSPTSLQLTFSSSVAGVPNLFKPSAYVLTRSDSTVFAVTAVSANMTSTVLTLTTAPRTPDNYHVFLEY